MLRQGLMHRSKSALFDHLVGTGEQCGRYIETERRVFANIVGACEPVLPPKR